MFPNPRQMEAAMRKLGIKNTPVEASRVIIEKGDGTSIVVEQPQVTEIDMQGQKSFQITGTITSKQTTNDEDVKLVMEKTGALREDAERALQESDGDIAAAIERLVPG
ncbi:Nascent polypeptide-associated complex protein [archaeon]|nr:Nascent polypeptide-associated complex protein [archaeon]